MEQNYIIKYPEGYIEDSYFQFEVEAKGYLQNVILRFLNRDYKLTFYDPIRLEQDILEELKIGKYYFASNLIVVESVNIEHINDAIMGMIRNGDVIHLLPVESVSH